MIKVKNIDHVAIAVTDAAGASAQLSGLFGLAAGDPEHVAAQKTDVIFLHPAEGGADLELICPSSGNDSLHRFLAKRGPGLHHVCFEVENLAHSLSVLKAAGIELIDEAPRPGARGHLVAFIHPR